VVVLWGLVQHLQLLLLVASMHEEVVMIFADRGLLIAHDAGQGSRT